jgi:hypothetical protein
MKPLNSSLTASLFLLGRDGYSTTGEMLPPDALVIVIQERADAKALPPLLQRYNCHRSECESLPVIRRKAENAYSKYRQANASIINLSG